MGGACLHSRRESSRASDHFLRHRLGFVFDTLLAEQTWSPIRPPECSKMFGIDPFWMLSFWIGYAGFVDWCLPFFAGRYMVPICAVLGAIFGPLTYNLGKQIGAILMDHRGLFLIALEHSICFPLLNVVGARSGNSPSAPRFLTNLAVTTLNLESIFLSC